MYTSKQLNTAHDTSLTRPGVEVQFRHMRESKRVLMVIDQLMEKLDKYTLKGAQLYVVVDETHRKEKQGLFQIKMRLTVPGEPLYVAQSQEKTGMHDGVFAAIAEGFDSIERQLVKTHRQRAAKRPPKQIAA
jgi:ribosome-associated translation inhibitor RaiA